MKTRIANKFDLPAVIDMMKRFRECTPVKSTSEIDNEEYFNKVFHHIILGGGIAIVAEKDDQVVGMIIGIHDNSAWDPNIKITREMAFWVNQEYRGSRAGYMLLKHYTSECEQLKQDGKIDMYTMTTLENSPNLKLDRFGYHPVETVWVGGLV